MYITLRVVYEQIIMINKINKSMKNFNLIRNIMSENKYAYTYLSKFIVK